METNHDAILREIAELLIARYGERAASHASLQALKARQMGLSLHMEAWKWIAQAIVEAMRAEEGGFE